MTTDTRHLRLFLDGRFVDRLNVVSFRGAETFHRRPRGPCAVANRLVMAIRSCLPASPLLLLAACAPALAPASSSPVVVAPIARQAATPQVESSMAEERIAAWERRLLPTPRQGNMRRQKLGRFVASYFESAPFGDRHGAIATSEVIVEHVFWEKLVSADRDIDGDGRADLLATVQRDPVAAPGPPRRWEVAFVADRPGGPEMLAVEGAESYGWQVFEWADVPVPTLVLRPAGTAFGRQVLAWNGHAMVATDTELLRWDFYESQVGQSCALEAIAAGKTLRWEAWAPGFIEDQGPPDGGLLDLRGDGPHFYVFRHVQPPADEASEATRTQVILELRKDGWVRLSAPTIDVSTGGDRDRNQVPDFECSLGNVDLATCTTGTDECEPFAVTALATWDGGQLAKQTPALHPVYATWLKEARDEVAALAARGRSGECPREHIITAGKLYLAWRWSGITEAKAQAEVNTLMRGISLATCAGPGMSARSWPVVWKDMKRILQWALPH